jgi:hypothetical protein
MDNSYPEPTNYMSFLQFFSLPAEGRATHHLIPAKIRVGQGKARARKQKESTFIFPFSSGEA